MDEQLLRASDAANRMAGPGGDRVKEQALLNRERRAGVIPAVGRIGPGGKDEFIYKSTDVACAAVGRAICDEIGIRHLKLRKAIYQILNTPGPSHIVGIMMDVSAGVPLRLRVRASFNPLTGDQKYHFQKFEEGKYRRPFQPLAPDYQEVALPHGDEINLSEVLRSFVEAAP